QPRTRTFAALAFGALALTGCAGRTSPESDPASSLFPPPNPYLADSAYPTGHTNPAQVDSTPVPGPTAKGHPLSANEIASGTTGPGHLANMVSSKYPNGKRVIWTNSQHDILKMDYETLHILARYTLDDSPPFTEADAERITA